MAPKLKVLGLTGGVGMGKSTAANLLSDRGVTIVDTDLLARKLVEPGQPALTEISKAFGAEMLSPDGSLRRDQLAHRVFSDSAAREKLEAILHPRIRKLWQSQLIEWRSRYSNSTEGNQSSLPQEGAGEKMHFFCVVIPLLFETRAETEVDCTICLACSSATQHQRLRSRGWNADQITQRIKSQLSAEEKMARANYVLWNDGSHEVLDAQIGGVLRLLAN